MRQFSEVKKQLASFTPHSFLREKRGRSSAYSRAITLMLNDGFFRCVWPSRQSWCPLWVIRVHIAMSALSSAIHNTGHYHVRPRPVCLSPSCARSANNGTAPSQLLHPGFARIAVTVHLTSISQLTSPPDQIASSCWRSLSQFQPLSGRHRESAFGAASAHNKLPTGSSL
jgi:hypothetical protein